MHAIGVDAGIALVELDRLILPVLDQLGWVRINRAADGALVSVDAVLPPPIELIALATSVMNINMPTPVERAALEILRATTRQPLELAAALEVGAEHGEQAAEDALRHLTAVRLVRQVQAEDGRSAVFNPNIWVGDERVAEAALRAEDARVRREVGALLEEVAASPGMPETLVSSTELRWVDFAVSQGLVQRSVVQTTEGEEKRFLFTPHLARDPFGVQPGDASGQVRQLVGSMVYAATFARVRLRSPAAFVRRLLQYGEAGDASPIGTDYPMLETGGIARVKPGSTPGRWRLELLQADVAEAALEILTARDSRPGGSATETTAELRGQRSYTHIERERARLAHNAPVDDADTRRLIAALRQSVRRGVRGS
ncbi:MAG TPA: hypothetical protein VG276_31610 [Actinomycetes bacterium]|nr:hypothetical protein [Actinomycetes bacterium]